MDKSKVIMMRDSITSALEDIEEFYGVKFSLGTISYSKNDGHAKLNWAEIDSNTKNDKYVVAETALRKNLMRYGLEPSIIGFEFSFRGDTFKVVGAKPRSYKYPILTENSKGKLTRFNVHDIKNAFTSSGKILR